VSNHAEIVRKNGYFVDKTEYIEKLEMVQNPIPFGSGHAFCAPSASGASNDVGPLL